MSKTSAHVACLLQTGIPLVGLRLQAGQGWPTVRLRTPAASPLRRGKRPFFRRCPRSRSRNPGALGLSQVYQRKTDAHWGSPHDPAVPGPSSAQSRTRAPSPPAPQLPAAPASGPQGGRGLHVRARRPAPAGRGRTPPLTRPPAALRFLRSVSPLRSSAGRSLSRGRSGAGGCSRSGSRALGLRRRALSAAAAAAAAARAGLSHGGCILTEPTAILMP